MTHHHVDTNASTNAGSDADTNTPGVSLARLLKEETAAAHDRAEHASFIVDLMTGKLTKEAFIALQEQALLFYTALENALDALEGDERLAKVADRRLDRTATLRHDVEQLGGNTTPDPLRATADYVAELNSIAENKDAPALIAHHYVRYLGDLSGGQVIASKMKSLLDIEPEALTFYQFPELGKLKPYKDEYREAIDGLASDLTEDEQAHMIFAAGQSFQLNHNVFRDLGEIYKPHG